MRQILEWLVIGAGPAGIAAVGKLLDQQIPANKIGWLDPAFKVGDLGTKWQQVSSNTKVSLFLKFLNGCHSFKYEERPKKFPIDDLNPQDHCLLKEVAMPLQWITNHLIQKVQPIHEEAIALNLTSGNWEVKTKTTQIVAKNVILGIGSEPKTLSYPHAELIPFDVSLNPDQLAQHVHSKDVIAVFGASHSAVLILASLMKTNVKMVYNFYRSPLLYAVELEDWILFDNTGLKGFAADWSRQNLDGKWPAKLKRLLVSDHTFEEVFALCNKVVYAVGFERRKLPVLEQYEDLTYNATTGIIAPGLFGLGIAFPQAKLDRLGNLEHRVGLWKFMDYLNEMIPIWLKYGNS